MKGGGQSPVLCVTQKNGDRSAVNGECLATSRLGSEQWLKCNMTQGNAVPSPTESGLKRFPAADILWTQGERYGDGMWADCIHLLWRLKTFFCISNRQSAIESKHWHWHIQTGVLSRTRKTIGRAACDYSSGTHDHTTTRSLRFPPPLSFHFNYWFWAEPCWGSWSIQDRRLGAHRSLSQAFDPAYGYTGYIRTFFIRLYCE